MAKWQKGQSGNPAGRPKGSKINLSILISLMATLLVSSPALGAKEKFERTKPHVNVGAQSRSSFFDSREIYTALPSMLSTNSRPSDRSNPTKQITAAQQQSNEPISQRYWDFDHDGYGADTGTPSVPSPADPQIHYWRMEVDSDPYYPGHEHAQTHLSGGPNNPPYPDLDSDGDGNSMGNTGRTVTPAYIENIEGIHDYANKLKRLPRESYIQSETAPRNHGTDMPDGYARMKIHTPIPDNTNQPGRHSFQPVSVEQGARAVCRWPFANGWPVKWGAETSVDQGGCQPVDG